MKKIIFLIALCLSVSLPYAKGADGATAAQQSDSSSIGANTDAATQKMLVSDFVAKYVDSLVNAKIGTISADLDTLYGEIEPIRGTKKIILWVWPLLLTLGLMFLFIYYFFKDRKNRGADIKAIVLGRDLQDDLISKIGENLKTYNTEKNVVVPNNRALIDRLERLENELAEIKAKKTQLESSVSKGGSSNDLVQPSPLPSRKYFAESIRDSRYVNVKDTQTPEAVFELTISPSGSTATVTICQSAYPRILANAAFIEGCDCQVLGHTSVEIKEVGNANRTDDDRWMVSKRVKVVLR